MDVKVIIRDLLNRGMTLEEIKRNLQELGVQNAEELVNSAMPLHDASLKSSQTLSNSKPEKAEPTPTNALNEKSKSLFQEKPIEKVQTATTSTTSSVQTKDLREVSLEALSPEDENLEPELQITSISSEGEKELTIGRQNKARQTKEKEKIFNQMPKNSFASNEELEQKLDEIIALLKSLQEINKKVLETDRSVLLRLKN